MYGMGGGFGNMPYQSPGSSILSGIQAGAGFIEHAQAMQDARDQRQYERERNDRLDQMREAHEQFMERHIADQDQRQHIRDVFDYQQKEHEDISNQYGDLISKYGSPEAAQKSPEYQQLYPRMQQYNQVHAGLMNQIYAPVVMAGNEWAKSHAQTLAQGQTDVHSPQQDDNTHKFLTVAGQRDPYEYHPNSGGGKSLVQQGLDGVHQAVGSGNQSDLAPAVQNLYGNIFNTQLGGMDATGNIVTDRSCNGFVPTPDGSGMHSVIQSNGIGYNGQTSTNPAAPPATDHHDPASPLSTITPGSMLERCGREGAISSLIANSQPLQDSLERSAKKPPQDSLDYAQAATAAGFAPQTTAHIIKAEDGSTQIINTDKHGRMVGQPVVAIPASVKPLGGEAQLVEEAHKQGILNDQEYHTRMHDLAMGVGGGAKADSFAERKFSMGLEYLKQRHAAGALDDDSYQQGLGDLLGVSPKASSISEPDAQHEGDFAAEQALHSMHMRKGQDNAGNTAIFQVDPKDPTKEIELKGQARIDAEDAALKARMDAHAKARAGGRRPAAAAPAPAGSVTDAPAGGTGALQVPSQQPGQPAQQRPALSSFFRG